MHFMNGTKRVYEWITLDTKRGNECFTNGTRWNKMNYIRNTTQQMIHEWNTMNTVIAWICIPVIYEATRCERPFPENCDRIIVLLLSQFKTE